MGQIDSTQLMTYCMDISANVRKAFPYLDLHFLVYAQGEKPDKIARLLPHLNGHPAFDEAASILKFRTTGKEHSAFLGIAEGYENGQIGNIKKRKALGFIAINISQYGNNEEAIMATHFFTAQMLDILAMTNPNDTRPLRGAILQPKRGQMIHCKTNLKSDIYSVLQLSREGVYDGVTRLAKRRSIETLTPQSSLRPEDFAFPLALDVTNYAIDNQMTSSVIMRGTSQIISQYQLANQITACFEQENLETWAQFADCAQTLAWCGFTASQILGAAVNTSTNPFIKATGHLLAELTNLSPVDEEHLPPGYNPFIANEINEIRHERAVEETFEMILYHVMEADSHLPLIRVANNQNEALTKGKVLGWCASALQAAAKAYIGAKQRGVPPVQAARLEFQSAKLQTGWKTLLMLNQHVISLYRKGEPVTLQEISKWCEYIPEARALLASLITTIGETQEKQGEDVFETISSISVGPAQRSVFAASITPLIKTSELSRSPVIPPPEISAQSKSSAPLISLDEE